MLAVTQYSADHIDGCRRRIAAVIAACSELPGGEPAAAERETAIFNAMVLALDRHFVHRVRKLEGKDGNPLNEVRVLCESLIEHGGVLTADKTIRMKPEESVLGLEIGDEIRLTRDSFRRLSERFLEEIESRYS